MHCQLIINRIIYLGMIYILSGCTNALYFYETEKISFTVEARPDSSQPVQGSLGIKQKVALVTPGNNQIIRQAGGCRNSSNNETSQQAAGSTSNDNEALSSISRFDFKIIPTSGTILDPVLIQTAFVTGNAASGLTCDQAAEVANAIVLDGSYKKDDAGDRLRTFWKPDGTNIDKTNQAKLIQWMTNSGLNPDTITLFLRDKNFSDLRVEAVKDLEIQ